MRRNRKTVRAGFSLIEILIYSLVLGLFLLLVTQVFISVKTINANSQALVSVQTNYRQILVDLTREVRGASEVTVPVAGATSENLSLDDGAVVYGLTEGVLEKTTAAGMVRLTTAEVEVQNLVFSNPVEATQSATIKIQMDLVSDFALAGGEPLVETVNFSVGGR